MELWTRNKTLVEVVGKVAGSTEQTKRAPYSRENHVTF